MTNPAATPPSFRDQIHKELSAISEDVLWTEKAHFAMADRDGHLHLWLGILATVAATVAAASVIGDALPAVSATMAVVAAITSAVVTFVKPQDSSQKHLAAGRRLGALRVTVRHVMSLDLHSDRPEQPEVWRESVKSLAREKAAIDADSPATSNWAFNAAGKKIRAGNFDHEG